MKRSLTNAAAVVAAVAVAFSAWAVLGLFFVQSPAGPSRLPPPSPALTPTVKVHEPSPIVDKNLPDLVMNVPFDITVGEDVSLAGLQEDFDVLSWDTFVALNWPPAGPGLPDGSKTIGENGDNPTVWETYKPSQEIFLKDGEPPAPWGATGAGVIPQAGLVCYRPGMRVLSQVGKTPGLLTESVQPFKTGPLIDQHGRYARFEILVNQSMFQSIVDNKLYSKTAQKGVKSVVFRCSSGADNEQGAIMVKAAWKLLTDEEKASARFHTAQALIYSPPSDIPRVAEKCETATVGLVGLHLVHKTKGAPQWVWSTFEQVDNCPTDGDGAPLPRYSFYNKNTPAAPKNDPPPRPWDPDRTEPPERRTQAVRMIPVTDAAEKLNARFQAALRAVNKGSVWQHYRLISTQWPTNPAKGCDVKATAPVDRIGTPAPQFLGNSTLETYIPRTVPGVSSSCMECHNNATTTAGVFSDFTFLLERAQ